MEKEGLVGAYYLEQEKESLLLVMRTLVIVVSFIRTAQAFRRRVLVHLEDPVRYNFKGSAKRPGEAEQGREEFFSSLLVDEYSQEEQTLRNAIHDFLSRWHHYGRTFAGHRPLPAPYRSLERRMSSSITRRHGITR